MMWTPSTPYDRDAAAQKGVTYREYRRWITPYRVRFWASFWLLLFVAAGLVWLVVR